MTKLFFLLIFVGVALSSPCFNAPNVVDIGQSCTTGPWALTNCSQFNSDIYCSRSCRIVQTSGNQREKVSCDLVNSSYQNCSLCLGGLGNVKCNGDTSYCDKYSCVLSSNCYCNYYKFDSVKQCDIDGVWQPVNDVQVGFSLASDQLFIAPPSTSNPWGLSISRSFRSSSTILFDPPKVIVGTQFPVWTHVMTSKDGLNEITPCNSTRCEVFLSRRYFINPGPLKVSVFINDTLDSQKDFDVGVQSRCDVPNCILCAEMIYDFQCYPWQFKMFIISMIVFSLIGSLLCLIIGVYMICRHSLIGRCCNCLWSKCKKVKDSGNKSIDVSEDDHDLEPVRLSPVRSGGRVPLMFIILICVPTIIIGQTCTQGITLVTDVSLCSVNKDIQTCSFSVSSLLSIPSPGLAACITLSDPDGNYFGNITVNYDKMIERAPLQTLYYTSSWNGISFSERNCPWEYMCGSCADYNPLFDPSAGGLIPELYVSYQGSSRCDSQCGCAGCGCFACSSSCVYSRAAIVPVGGTLLTEVLRPISVHQYPVITVSASSTTSSESQTFEGLNEDIIVLTNFTVRVEGSLTGSATIFGYEKVTSNGIDTRMGSASDVNAPVVGAVGDIQASSPGQLSPYSPYKIAAGLFTAIPTSDATNYAFAANGIISRTTHDVLPVVRGTTIWSRSGYSLVGINSDPGALLVTLSSPTEFKLQRKINVVCPKIISVTLVGCIACDQGATLVVEAQSTCSPGMALVIVDGTMEALTPSVVLNDGSNQLLIRVHSGVRDNHGTITLKSGIHSDTASYSGRLQPESLVVVGNGTFDNNNGTDSNGGIDVAGLFGQLPSPIQILIAVLGSLAALVVSIILVIVIIKSIKAYSHWKEVKQYQRITDEHMESPQTDDN